MGMQSTERDSGRMAPIWPSAVLHQGALAGARDPAENADAQRNALAHGVRGGSGFGFDFDLFGAVIEQADADVIEAEIFLDFSDDLAQHVDGIVAGNCGAGDVVQEGQLAGAALFFGEEAGVFDRDGDLSGSGHEHIDVALFEHEFAIRAHGNHHARGFCP
jgi:hypothetical protein